LSAAISRPDALDIAVSLLAQPVLTVSAVLSVTIYSNEDLSADKARDRGTQDRPSIHKLSW